MALQQPTNIEECIYFTNRSIWKGKTKVWVFREKCPQCKEGLMGKPKNPKSGKPFIRAKEYTCSKCNHCIEGKEYENTLIANILYTCQYCSYEGEIQIPFKRKRVKIKEEDLNDGEPRKAKVVDALQFQCQKCGKNIDVTKKMK